MSLPMESQDENVSPGHRKPEPSSPESLEDPHSSPREEAPHRRPAGFRGCAGLRGCRGAWGGLEASRGGWGRDTPGPAQGGARQGSSPPASAGVAGKGRAARGGRGRSRRSRWGAGHTEPASWDQGAPAPARGQQALRSPEQPLQRHPVPRCGRRKTRPSPSPGPPGAGPPGGGAGAAHAPWGGAGGRRVAHAPWAEGRVVRTCWPGLGGGGFGGRRAGPRGRTRTCAGGGAAEAGRTARMEGEAGRRPLGVFKCQLCALTAPYSYVGQKPPDTHSVVLLEESYIMKDPFTPDKDRFLVLGSRCSLCSQLVCVSPECSLFYSKRFCLPCVRENMDAFPQEIRQDLEKRKAPSKRPASQPGSRT